MCLLDKKADQATIDIGDMHEMIESKKDSKRTENRYSKNKERKQASR
jgi:hypothetical protein